MRIAALKPVNSQALRAFGIPVKTPDQQKRGQNKSYAFNSSGSLRL